MSHPNVGDCWWLWRFFFLSSMLSKKKFNFMNVDFVVVV